MVERGREKDTDSGRGRNGERKEGGRESLWGRVALQSLAEIAVTHYYTHTGTYTHIQTLAAVSEDRVWVGGEEIM